MGNDPGNGQIQGPNDVDERLAVLDDRHHEFIAQIAV